MDRAVTQQRSARAIALGFAPALLVAAASTAFAAPDPSAPGLTCEIAVQRGSQAIRLTAIAHSEHALTAQYRFAVFKNNSTGLSQTIQSGSFTTSPGGSDVLTSVMLDASARGHYSARLALDSDQGSASCSSP